jgi:hypothetical protein
MRWPIAGSGSPGLVPAAPRRHNRRRATAPPNPVLTYDPQPSAPRLRLPAGACDTHVHVFGPAARFPYAASRNFTPVDAPKEALFALHRTLGISAA